MAFPELFNPAGMRKGIDSFVDAIVTRYGDSLGALSDHFERWLSWFEKLLRTSPWWAVVSHLPRITTTNIITTTT